MSWPVYEHRCSPFVLYNAVLREWDDHHNEQLSHPQSICCHHLHLPRWDQRVALHFHLQQMITYWRQWWYSHDVQHIGWEKWQVLDQINPLYDKNSCIVQTASQFFLISKKKRKKKNREAVWTTAVLPSFPPWSSLDNIYALVLKTKISISFK